MKVFMHKSFGATGLPTRRMTFVMKSVWSILIRLVYIDRENQEDIIEYSGIYYNTDYNNIEQLFDSCNHTFLKLINF